MSEIRSDLFRGRIKDILRKRGNIESELVSGVLDELVELFGITQHEFEVTGRVFKHSIDMLCIAGFDGYFKSLNPSWTRELGWSTEELLAKPWLEFVHPDDRTKTEDVGISIVEGQKLYQFENRYICKDGSVKWLSWNTFPYPDDGVMFGVARNITDWKKAEEKLIHNEQKLKEQLEEFTALNEELSQMNNELRTIRERLERESNEKQLILNSIPDLFVYYDLDRTILWANRAAARSAGREVDQLIGMKCSDVFTPCNEICLECPVVEVYKTAKSQTAIIRMEDGRVMDVKAFPSFDRRGNIIGVVETLRDITEFRNTQFFNEQLVSVLDLAPNAITVHTLEGKILYSNQKNLQLHGYTQEELLNRNVFDLDTPECNELVEGRIAIIREKGEAAFEVMHKRKDGSLFPLELLVKLVEWEGQQALISIGTDISERKKNEERMLALSTLLDNSNSIAVVKDLDLKIIAANTAIAKATGYSSVDELIGRNDSEVFRIPQDQEPVRTYMDDERRAQTLPKGEFLVREEPFVLHTGEEIILQTKKYPVYNNDGKLIGTGNISTDITESKRTLDEVESQNMLMTTLLENLQVGVFMVEAPTGKPLLVNRKAKELLGKGIVDEANAESLAEVYSAYRKGTNELYPADLMPLVRGLSGESSWIDDMEISTPDGTRILLDVQGVPVRDGKNRIVASLANFIDITERVKAKEAIEQERILLRTVIDSMPDAIYVKDTETRKLIANKADCNNIGVESEEEIVGRTDFDFFPHENAQAFYNDDIHVINNGQPIVNREERFIKSNGEEIVLNTTKKPLRDVRGKIIGLVGVGRDITQEKMAIEKLKESQQLIELILNTVPVRVFWKDTNLNFLGCNLPFARDAGLNSPEEIVGKDDYCLSWAENAGLYRQDDRAVIESGVPKLGFEEPQITPQGDTLWLRTSKVPLRNAKGSIIGILGTYENITKSKEVEEKLRNSDRIFTHALDMLCIIGFDGFFKTLNPSWSKKLGWSNHELKEKPWFEFIHPDSVEDTNASIAIKGEVTNLENRFQCKDGNYKWLAWSLFSYPEERVLYGVVRDITEDKNIEGKLREQNEEYLALNEELTESSNRILKINSELVLAREKAEESDRLKTAFLANMSHEIRTPMNSIVGFSEILLNPNLEPEKQKYFTQIINSACHQLLSVINDVIDIAKIETNQITLYESELNLNGLLRRTQTVFAPEASKRGVEFLLEMGLKDSRSIILADEAKLMQVINNLVSNACKFTERGAVSIGYTPDGSSLKFYVKDTGIGIAPEYHDLIFQRFRQVDMADSRKYGGTGLGLAIAKAFVDLFGGTIWLESTEGKGSTFYFTLPYKHVNIARDENEPEPDFSSYSFSGRSILVAEDEIANYMLIDEIFAGTRLKLLHATNGVEVVEMYRRNTKIDMVIMDIKMPKMNGIDAIKCIRALNPTIPIFAHTAYAMAGDKEKCLDAGANEYLSKPITRIELLELVNKYLG